MTATAAAQADSSTVLANAAFGDDPGRWPLPAATTPHELWLRAVVSGGQGRYGCAFADLAGVLRQSAGPLASMAHSTHASFLRQLGWHIRARTRDGRASALAVQDVAGPAAPVPDVGSPAAPHAYREARADALIGLAADALGVGRFTASERFLQRAQAMMSDSESDRLPVRVAWVTAELAMARGDGVAAVGHAEQAVELAAKLGSARHTVKSDVILAAALCSAGELERSRPVADAALEATARLRLIPLRWALACLLSDIGSATYSAAQVVNIRGECADTVRRGGGQWSDRWSSPPRLDH